MANISFNPSIGEAINCLSLYKDHVPENGYISACLDLGISALKTIQDGNYQLSTSTISPEILDEIVNYTCTCQECDVCKYFYKGHCLYEDARALKNQREYYRRLQSWIQKNC